MVVRGGVGAQVFITFLKRLLAGMDHPIFLIGSSVKFMGELWLRKLAKCMI